MSLSLSQSKLSLKDSITELDFNICAPIFLKVIESDSNSVIKSVTLSSVYFPKTSNANAQTYMKQLWDIETELFERYYPIPYSLSVEKLVELLSKHEKDIFDYKPESYNIFGVDHVKYVAKISRDLLTLVSDSKSTAKHSLKLIKAEQVRDDQLLPNLRLLFESQRVDGYSLFLRQEAMNARLIVKKSGSSQRLKNITEFIYNSINYCRPTLYDISSILNLQVFLDNLSGFNFSEPRKLALYSKNDKAPGFIGIKLVGGTMNDKFQLSIQENKSQTLPLVKFKQAVESGNGVNCKIKLSTGESVGTCLIESDPDFKPHQNDVNLEESPQDGITTRDYIMTHNWPQSDLKLKGIKKGEYKSLVYVCSSSDCENERDVISELSRELDYKTFFVQYLECSDKEKQLDNLRVSLSLMERSDVALFLMGTRLGRLYEPEEIKLIIPPNRISLLKYQNAMFDIEIQITYARQILKRENIVFFYRHKDFNLTVPKMLRHRFLAETMHEEQVSQTIIDYIDEKVVYSVVFSHVADNKVIMGKLSTLREQLHTSCNSAIKSSLISRVESESVKFRDFDLLPYQADFIQNILEKIETYSTGTCIILKGEAGSGKSTLVDLVCAHLNYENWLVLNEKIDAKKLIPLLRSYASALAFSSHEEAIPHRAFELETCFKNIIRSRLATSCKIVLVIQNYTNFNTSLLSKLINGCEGKGGKIIWLLTSNEDSHLKIDSSELKIHTVPLIDRTDLMHVAKSLIGSGSIEIAEKISSEYLFKCTTLFHLNLVLSNIKLKRESGLFVKISRIPDSSIGLIEEILNRFEQSENSKYIQQCLTLLCVSRSGLNELEICGILSLSNILWDYVFKTLIPYFKVSRNGQIELYHDIFRTIVRYFQN